MSELSAEGRAILKEALERQSIGWFEEASELAIATRVLFREMNRPALHLDTPKLLTPAQLAQRKQILGIAHAVLEAATLRAIENALGSMYNSKEAHDSTPSTGDVGGGGSEGTQGSVP